MFVSMELREKIQATHQMEVKNTEIGFYFPNFSWEKTETFVRDVYL